MMGKILHRMWNWIDHNPWVTGCVIVALVTVGCLVGCKSRAAGVLTPELVTRPAYERQVIVVERDLAARRVALESQIETLNVDIVAANADIDAGRSHLDREDEFRASILSFVGGAVADAMSGTIDPGGLVTSVLLLIGGAAGIGTLADRIRKDRVIKELKANGGTSTG